MYTKLLKLFKPFLRLEKHRTELKLKDIEIRVALLNHVRSVWAFIISGLKTVLHVFTDVNAKTKYRVSLNYFNCL